MIFYVLLLVGLPALYISAASVPLTIDFARNPTLSNLSYTDLQAQSNGSAVEGDLWSWYCTSVDQWALPEMEPDDCEGVLDYFYIQTMKEGGNKRKEFLAPDAKKTTYEETERTPRKYTFGTCTLAIVMVEDFPHPASLPGGSKKGPLSDSSTYYNLWKVAENLVQQCVLRRRQVGWQPTGLQNGIGVFIWSTESQEDLEIEADEPRVVFPMMPGGNDSVASV